VDSSHQALGVCWCGAMHSMREAIRLNEAQASKPEPHPEAEAIRTALESFDSWAVEVEGYKPGEVSGEALAALDVLVGRLEQAEARVTYLLTTDPIDWEPEVIRWLRPREALGVPPQPEGSGS
jgi:hypothetical protein